MSILFTYLGTTTKVCDFILTKYISPNLGHTDRDFFFFPRFRQTLAFDEQKIKLRLKEKERKKKEKEVLILVVHDGVVKSPFIKAECSKNFNHGEI